VTKTIPVQQRVAPRQKQCPLCKKSVTKADFDGKKAKYGGVAHRSQLGLRWQQLSCISRDIRRRISRSGNAIRFLETVFNYPTLAECYKVAALDAHNKLAR